jgi:glucosamine 6-phosphate synthetase-like amidotransferase/phosphosugar isomerase protein
VLAEAAADDEPVHPNALDIGPVDRMLAPAVSIVPAQLLAWRMSVLRGRTPGAYYRAAKVTTRE